MSRKSRLAVQWALAAAAVCLMLLVGLATAGAAESGPGEDHLVVSRLPTASTSQAVTLVRMNGSGTSDGSNWALPTTTSGSNHPFTLQGNSDAVGALALSADGRYVTLAGYTTAVGGNPEAADPRDVARVNSVGTVDTSTVLGTTFEKEKIRGAVSNDGSSFWVTGNGNGTAPLGGMVYAPVGSSSPTIIVSKEAPVSNSNKALNNFRSVQIAGGNLYMGSEKGTAGVYSVPGLPTHATTATNLIALSGETDPISELPLEHEVGSGKVDLMYVARESEGIYKYSLSGSSWVERGRVVSGNFAGLTGKVDSSGHFRIYAIKGYEAEDQIVSLTDSAAFSAAPSASTPVVISTAPSGTAYRGIAFAPHDAGLEVPGAPTAVGATADNASANLSWTAPTETGGSSITAYKITPFIAGVPQATITTPSAATSFKVEGLTNGTAYTFTVAAVNSSGPGAASSPSAAVTPQAPGAATPTIHLSDEALEGTNGDPTNPTVSVEIAQAGVESSALSVAATASSKPTVAAIGGVSVAGSGATRTVSVTPAGGVGHTDITLRVTGAEGKSATTTLHYAASATSPTPTSRYHTGAADASTAVDVGGGYMLIGDDESNTLRLYPRDTSGAPVKEWNFNSQMGNPEEIDIEASARSGNTIYWTGSMGNSKKGNLKPDRSILFTTHVSGSGAATELSFGGYYRGLRADLIKWDEENGNRFGFKKGAAEGNIPKLINGFNVEGLEFAPGSSSTAYVGFRAPLSPAAAGGDAIVVPVTNIDQLATSGQNTSVHAGFGAPILMNLGGLSVREIRKNADDEYLILAGSWAAGGEYALYTWDGVPADAPVRVATSLPAGEAEGEDPGAWESIVEVPDPLRSGDDVELVMDNGSTDFYGDGVEAKELIPEIEKSRSDHFTLQIPETPVNLEAPQASGKVLIGNVLRCEPGTWSGSPAPSFTYRWQRNGADIEGAEEATYTTTVADSGQPVRCAVTAHSSAGETVAFSNPIDLWYPFPRCTGADISGAGTPLQDATQNQVWAPAFETATCDTGSHPTVGYEAASSGAAMNLWNADGTKGAVDTDLDFVGTDEAPTAAQIANIKAGTAGSEVAVIPVAQTAIALIANPPAGCSVEAITNTDLAAAMEGRLSSWSKLETAEGSCNSPITRVVRKDASGTTSQLQNYLSALYAKGLFCTSGSTEGKQSWKEIGGAWPESCGAKALSAVVRPAAEGGQAEVAAVDSTPGSIGYAALPDAEAGSSGGATILALQNNGQKKGGEANFGEPAAGESANCGALPYEVPTVNARRDLDWSGVFAAKPAIGAGAYPLCMLTYDVALHAYGAAGFTEATELSVRDYVLGYVLGAGQTAAASHYLSPLSSSTVGKFDVLGAARKAAESISY